MDWCAQEENTLLLTKVATQQLKRFSISTQSDFILLIEEERIQNTDSLKGTREHWWRNKNKRRANFSSLGFCNLELVLLQCSGINLNCAIMDLVSRLNKKKII